jgi:hypothetical protein
MEKPESIRRRLPVITPVSLYFFAVFALVFLGTTFFLRAGDALKRTVRLGLTSINSCVFGFMAIVLLTSQTLKLPKLANRNL